MVSISAKIREKKEKAAGKSEILPVILYGPKVKNLNLTVSLKDFEQVYEQTGESSLVSLEVEGKKDNFLVLIHDVQQDPLTGKPIHVDFYQPDLKEMVETTVPIVVKGESPAIKSKGGTLVKKISEIEVKALPQNLPKEILVNIETLQEIGDHILVGSLKVPEGVKVQRDLDEIIMSVSAPEKVEEELEKPIEEKVEEVEKSETKQEQEPEEKKQESKD
jgi:large subunit ribosomal protein L25